MRDLQRVNADGVGKSRGFAFVNFSTHQHALKALRALNNNSQVFGEKRVRFYAPQDVKFCNPKLDLVYGTSVFYIYNWMLIFNVERDNTLFRIEN